VSGSGQAPDRARSGGG